MVFGYRGSSGSGGELFVLPDDNGLDFRAANLRATTTPAEEVAAITRLWDRTGDTARKKEYYLSKYLLALQKDNSIAVHGMNPLGLFYNNHCILPVELTMIYLDDRIGAIACLRAVCS